VGVYAGVEPTWASQTNTGRTHIATKGIVQSGLVLNLDAGVSSSYSGSGTTWTDLSGNGNTGTLVNGPTYSSSNGGSIVLDAIDDYVTLSSALNLSTNIGFTMCLFLQQNTTQTNSTWNYFYSRLGPDIEIGAFGTSSTSFNFKDNTTNSTVTSSNLVTSWSYIAFGTSPTTRIPFIYTYNSSGSFFATSATAFSNTTIGFERLFITGTSGGPGGTQYYGAKCAVISAYNRALTAAEILQNFRATKSRFGL
jgi:hypothetical protein